MFGNILKGIGNAVTAPFKSVGDIVSGKGNIGDLFNIASVFAPGGNLTTNLASYGTKNIGINSFLPGVADIAQGKGNVMDWMNIVNAYANAGAGGGGGYKPSGNAQQDLAAMMFPLIQSDVLFALANQPRAQQSRLDAANALDPSNQAGMYAAMIQQAMNAAGAAGAKHGKQLKSQGFGDSVQAGAQVNAQNQAVSNVNSQQVNTPEGIANAYAQIAQLLSGSPNLQGYSQAQQLGIQKRAADAQYNATKPPTFWESLLATAGTTLPYILNSDGKDMARAGGESNRFYDDPVGPNPQSPIDMAKNFAAIRGRMF